MMDGDISGTCLLRMRGIRKSFGRVCVLDGVDFDLEAGEVHILAGENGAGKSTLIKILAGVHTGYEGEITLAGNPVRFRGPQHAALYGISVIHQELSLISDMSVTDNLFLGREHSRLGWMGFRSQRRACRELLRQLGLDINPDRLVADYPLSTRQTIEIAKALAFQARIIVMDEPTSALTEPEVERLFTLISDLKARGCGVVYISHKMEEIYRIADRITVLRDGKGIGTAHVSELPRPELIRWMVGREVTELFPERPLIVDKERLRVEGLTVPDPAGAPRPLVDHVSLSLRAGEILGVGGLQGSGASELFHALFGTYGRIRGQVWIDGAPHVVRSPAHSIANGVALLTNDRKGTGLVAGMGITRNITLASIRRYSPGGWFRPSLERACAERHRKAFGIKSASLDQPVESLSGGNQQKVVLAKWMETRPRVLLLDEPTRGVDVGAKHEIYALMNQWTAQGIAILLITSEMPELLALSDRLLVMHRGVVTASFGRDEATQEKVLQAAMGIEQAVAG